VSQEKNSRSEHARINGAKSKGPKTPEGKAKCARVNITHAAYVARQSTLSFEDQNAYAAVWLAAMDQFNPRNAFEGEIVAMIVDLQWAASRLVAAARAITEARMRQLQETAPNTEMRHLYVRAEMEGTGAESLERRARQHSREVSRLIKTLKDLREFSSSDEGSQIAGEILLSYAREHEKTQPLPPLEPFQPHYPPAPPAPPAQNLDPELRT